MSLGKSVPMIFLNALKLNYLENNLENRSSIMQQPPEVRGSLYSPEFPGA
ncbi:hypothetical protein HKBW3S47_00103 [Candidatus Hakubella thermalkaliphila]|uniref:Uncharacterized protein n=1 Tax=Candidatus Hakubella thermalkaliphila TaxID=2754717 RepID=A0A6V8Q0W7_9ACTN|nr:hypothetical protein HKBW3S47_00103 [Candidatus Hakubella thermalkaliphila]